MPTGHGGNEFRGGCDQAVDQCRKDKKPVWEWVNKGHKFWVVDDASACSQAIDYDAWVCRLRVLKPRVWLPPLFVLRIRTPCWKAHFR